jgi:acyl-CoA thioester hydrolase
VRQKVLKFAHQLANVETGVVCATSAFTVVCIDSAARRARAFPEDIAARARAATGEFPAA